MPDHLTTLRALVAAGEKFAPEPLSAECVGPSFLRAIITQDDEAVLHEPTVADRVAPEYSRGVLAFAWRAANARPALAALLRVCEAAKVVSDERDRHDGDYSLSIEGRAALDALDAALRDLSPEVEDA